MHTLLHTHVCISTHTELHKDHPDEQHTASDLEERLLGSMEDIKQDLCQSSKLHIFMTAVGFSKSQMIW